MTEKRQYKAYEKHDAPKTKAQLDLSLDIIDPNGVIDTLYYPSWRMRYTADDLISLICIDCVVTFKGRNLKRLRESLRDQKVALIEIYNAHYHDEPAEGDTVVEKVIIEPRQAGGKDKPEPKA